MEVASFSKTVEELLLEWVPDKPVRTTPVELNLFQLDKIETKYCRPESSAQIGNYSCLVAEFHLSRSLGFHLVQSYLPTILMVVISWVSFWMDVNSVPGRVTLGITTLLTVSSISTSIQENLPQASYVKAIDVWLGTCTAFVFLALLEFTFVNYLFRRSDLNECFSEEGCRTYPITHHQTGNYSDHNCSTGVNGCRKLEKYEEAPSTCSTIVQQVRDREEGKLSNHLEPQFIGVSSPDHSSLCDASYPPMANEDIPRLKLGISTRLADMLSPSPSPCLTVSTGPTTSAHRSEACPDVTSKTFLRQVSISGCMQKIYPLSTSVLVT
ncbi:unnamed protein product [Allacma fusca]|uniref:Neurotransmitter-gated ion-channel transmembrane domain-containing protein n=1 Tax=Allacma fusca TaxID=39272 RepID=A0A8J2PNV5_9HEXA|nr:unnamed protein product [Allacma fusca]